MVKILYAEDEEDIRVIARFALEDLGGFTVEYCANGTEVLSKIDAFQPDLLLLDVMMPQMDGPATLKKLRENPEYRKIPAIFMTAKIQPDEILQYQEIGGVEVIAKPFDAMKLAENVRLIWEKYNIS